MKTNKLLLLALALVFVIAFAACDVDPIVNSNAINGLADISLTCGDSLPEITPTSEYGEITLGIAKAVEGTSKEELTYAPLTTDALTVGTYYVKASVAAASTYEAAAAYATITVSHQAFDSIAGEGTAHSETTADGKYHTWTEKQCVCGATVIGNEQTADKQPNAISGLADVTLNCGVSPDLSGITATHGDVVLAIATAVEGTDKEQLTYAALPDDLTVVHGVYYVRATVAEGENYQGATLYAKVTVEHLAFADIDGEATHVAAEGTTKGYDYKTCACGEQIKGDEYVIVTIKVDGEIVATEEVVVGGMIDDGAIDETNLPTRNGYELVLVDVNGGEWEYSDVEDFATIELGSYWIGIDYVDLEVTGGWMFAESNPEDVVSKLTYNEDDKAWVVNTVYVEDKDITNEAGNVVGNWNKVPAEVTLSDIELKVGHTYVITLATDKRTYVNFGTETWDDYAYIIDNEFGLCIITVTYTGDDTIVTYNDSIVQYTNDQWSKHNLNGLTLAIQSKYMDAGTRFNVAIASTVVELYDYCAHEAQLVNTLPEAANVDENSAEAVMATINQIEAIRTAHFTEAELADAKDISDVKDAAQAIINNHILNLNKLFKEYKAGSAVDGKLELFAKFSEFDKTRARHNVTLKNLEGDDQVVEVYDGDAAVLPMVVRSGYIFDCWLLDGEKYNTKAEVTSNIELVAKWLVRANGEKATVISAGDLSANVTGTLNDGRTDATDKADSWWTDNDGTKLDQWFLVGNNKTKALLTFELPVIDFSNYSQLSFNLLINGGFTGSISIVPDGSENATDLAANSQGGCVKMVLAKVNGVWTIAAHCENGNVQSAAIPANVVAGEAKLTLRYWTNADWTTNAEGELVDGPWVFMSEVKGIAFGNVDYIQKAASAAAAIDALASDADDATKLAALKTYLSWRSHFTAYELAANPMSEKAAAIKATATREKIWAPTNDNLGDIGYDINLNDGKAANQTRPSDWTWIADKDNNAFVQAHYFNFGVNPLTDRTLSFTMPTINYAMYSEVRFAILVQNTNTAQGADLQTLTINGVTAQPSAVSLTTYVVYVKTVNGVTTFEICYNLDSTVVASGTLSSSVAHGFEGLTLDVDVDGWTQVQFYEVFATL